MPDPLTEKIIREMNLRNPQEDSLIKFAALLNPIDIGSLAQERVKGMLQAGVLRFTDPYGRLTFALATGIGKTRLMGAIMAWLFLSGKSKNFVILTPSSTIYKKTQAESQPTHKKYLFAGLSAFPLPEVITADTAGSWNPEESAESRAPTLFILTPGQIRPRSGSETERRLRQENEQLGESFVEHLTNIKDLVVFLDEGHRYGQDARQERAWARAITDLKPKFVIEMTATPSNDNTVVHRYTLGEALREGLYIKNVEAIYQRQTQAVSDKEWDQLTLREGLKQLEIKKRAIESFRANYPDRKQVKPVMLVACRDTTHSQGIERWLESNSCEKGAYRGKVLRVDITQSEEEIAKLLEIENPRNPTEIVVNVGMLREGWDVENVYVIVPLRATASETLAIQTIGRGLRLPYGERVGDFEVDTLHVLTFGRETVHRVIEVAKEVGISISPSGPSGKQLDYQSYKVEPRKKLKIPFPVFAEKTTQLPDLKKFHPEVHVSIKSTSRPTITKIELPTGTVRQQEDALLIEGVTDFPKRLGQLLTAAVPEIGGQDREAKRIFKGYFKELGCKDESVERSIVQSHGGDILTDVIDQINQWLDKGREDLEDVGGSEPFVFRAAEYSAPAKILKKQDTELPRDRAYLIEGWKHSLYPRCRFDTKQELQVALILDDAESIIWVRNPIHQFPLDTTLGKHYPDFIVVYKNRIIFIEVKDIDELRDSESDAYKKGKEVTAQCETASRSSKHKWEYWAIPHDQVENCATLEDLARHRFRF